MNRIVYIVTNAITAQTLLRGQLRYLRERGMDVILITSPSKNLHDIAQRENAVVYPIPMQREIGLFRDLRSLLNLYRVIRELKPDIVNASTPKAGFLGMIAAKFAGVRVRIYTLRGLRLESKSGLQKFILRITERVASACANQVLCVSQSLKNKYVQLQLCPESKITVLGKGSSNGIDFARFLHGSDREDLRKNLGIPNDSLVVGFVGRLTKDKGVSELLESFEMLHQRFERLFLLVLGDFEEGDPLNPELASRFRSHPHIIHQGFVEDTALYYGAMDLLAFPSYREGFPNAPLEAAAAGIPTVGFKVTGTVDAVQDGITGRLVCCGNVQELVDAIASYLQDEDLRRGHGKAARERARQHFDNQMVWDSIFTYYAKLLS